MNLSEEAVPIEGAVEEDKLAELVLLWQEVRLLRAAQLELIAEEPLTGEIGLSHGGELRRAEFNEGASFLLADPCDVTEIAEEVIDMPDLHLPPSLKGENSPSFLGHLSWGLITGTGVRMRVEKRVDTAPDFKVEWAFLSRLLTLRLRFEYFPCELLRIVGF